MQPHPALASRFRVSAAIAVVGLAMLAVTTGLIVCSRDGGGGRGTVQDLPIEREPPADGWAAVDVPPLDDTYTLTVRDETEDGIPRDAEFVLESSAGDLDADALASLLAIDPPLELEIEGSPDRVTLRPRSLLREGTRYRFALHSASDGRQLRSWAFQTQSPLRVVQTLPANRATNVPLDTGIELTFSHDGVSDIADQFSISPPVEGRFEVHKRVVVFVPKQLAAETLYTVTLAAGVRAGADLETAEASSFAFETGSALRGESPPAYADRLYFARLVFEASTIEPATMQLDVYQPVTAIRLPVEVFRYDDAGEFMQAIRDANSVPYWSLYTRKRFRLDASGLDPVATFDVDATQFGTNSYQRFIAFPEPLEAGFYLVQAEHEGEPVQALLQVTDLAAYASVSTSKTLVWVNDLASGAPVAGAGVRDDDGHTHTTNRDGVAMFDTPVSRALDSAPSEFLRVEHEGRSAIVSFHAQMAIGYYGSSPYDQRGYGGYYPGYQYESSSPDYWSYFYPDRTLYRPSDEIHFWGVARKRVDFEPGATLTARLGGGGYDNSSYGSSVLAETDVSVSDIGTFEGSLPFEGVAPGGYQLSIVAGDETIAASYIQVQNFIKPAYKIEATPSRWAVYAGETMTFDITSEFFDGSPVPFVDFTYHGPEEGGAAEKAVRTDADGVASIPYVGQSYGPFGGPAYRGMSLYPTGPEQSEIYVSATVFVLPSALTVKAEGEVDSGRATVTGSVHDVDLSAFDDGESGDWYRGYEGAPSAGRAVTANVIEQHYNKIEDGEVYDFIAKVTRKRYRYETVERSLGTFSAVSGADGAFSFGFPVQPDLTYIAHMTVVDDAGRTGGSDVYVSGDDFVYVSYSDTGLSLQETTSDPAPFYSYSNPPYAEGDPVDLSVRRSGDAAETGAAYRYLFVRARDGIRDYVSAAAPRLQWDFSDEDVPSVSVSAVQFNGRGYEVACCDFTAQFKREEREITVEVTADAERYEPGSDVTLAVRTLDAAGAAVSAEVLLSLVDEALFQLQGADYQSAILEQIYRPLPSGIIATYVPSYTDFSISQRQYGGGPNTGGSPGAAVGGPDTGPGPRSDFRDLALFRTLRTDANGAGTLTFTLPDNITSWRVTSRAVTGDLRAGASVTAIPVGLPFFVEVTAADEYLAADRPIISLRAFGRALTRGDLVAYTVDAPSLGVTAATVSGEAFRGAGLALPPLSEGEHEITVRATSADLADGIVRTLLVVPSRLRRGEARFYELTPGIALEGASGGLTDVVFSDHNRGRHYGDLVRLSWGHGDRVDQQLARALSWELLVEFFDADVEAAAAEFDASLYQTANGGIALFPYAQEELALSARALSVAPSKFGRNALAQYFQRVFDDPDETRERAIIALWGLAAAGESVLPSIDALGAAGDLTPRERLYLGLAALAAGDDAMARYQYRQVVARYAERREPFVRVRTGSDQDDILELTALAADLGAGIGDPSAAPMYAYTQANGTTDLLVELDQVSYLARALPLLPSEPVRFAYTLRGERAEQSLEAARSFRLTLTRDDLAALQPEPLEGHVGIATFFEAPFDPATAVTDPDIALTRVVDVGGGGIAEGDVVEVRLNYVLAPQSLDGCYQVNDLAPSGLRPITQPQRYYYDSESQQNSTYPYRIEGQLVSFCIYKQYLPHDPLVYFARVVTKGDYAVEPAIIQSQQSADSFNLTPSQTITIR